MNLLLLQPAVREYLMKYIHDNAASFILKSHPFTGITAQELTQQLIGLQKSRSKFPDLFENENIIFPPKINLEQTSSQSTAQYKAQLYTGEHMIDLTGGFGVDVYAFAKAYSQTTHVEINASLQKLAEHALQAQGLSTKSICDNGIELLKRTDQHYDLIYLDPSRKTATNSKAILLEDYEPNVIEHLDVLLKKSSRVMIKTSPMLDITAGLSQLKNVAHIYIVAVKNEVKELLWIIESKAANHSITCVNLETNQAEFKVGNHTEIVLSEPLKYLYEPNAAMMKSQAFGAICAQFSLYKIDHDAHLFTSDQLISFPGRVFNIELVQDYKPKLVKRQYAHSHRAVVIRNFRESVHQLRKKFSLKEHDSDYLFFTSSQGKPVVISAKKL